MQPSIAVLAYHGYLLLVLSILKLTLASHISDEGPFGAELTECPTIEPPPTMVRRPLPSEMWRLILEKCKLTEYVHFLLAFPELQSLRFSEAVEFDILEKAFQELDRMNSHKSKTFDYERYESMVATIRDFIELASGQLLVEGEAASGADDEIRKTVVRLADKFSGDSQYSRAARRILFSALIEHVHGADIGLVTFQKYRHDILYAAALNGNYEQLKALVDESELGWNAAAGLVAPAIAQNGSAELFAKVMQVFSLEAFADLSFWTKVIEFNKAELFLELVLQLKPELDGTDLNFLRSICQSCCHHERQELIRVLIEHTFESLLQINLMECLFKTIETGNINIFSMLLGDLAHLGLQKSSLLDYRQLLNFVNTYNRVDMVQFMLSLNDLGEPILLKGFSGAVLNGNIEIMELLLAARPDGQMWISTCSCLITTETIKNIGISGRVDVCEFFIRKRDEGDPRFDGFSVGMGDNAILCSACSWGNHELVKYLLRRNEETNEFIFPDVNPAARNNHPLFKGVYSLLIMEELLRQDHEEGMLYPNVAITDQILLRAAASSYYENFEFLLLTVKRDDNSIRFKFPIVDINFDNHHLLNYLIEKKQVSKLAFLLRRDPNSGNFVLPGIQVPDHLLEQLRSRGVLE